MNAGPPGGAAFGATFRAGIESTGADEGACPWLGVGWVSFYREPFLQHLLGIPAGIRPVAWLCLGPVTHLEDIPDLERHAWAQRRPLHAAVHAERWGAPRH